jgi:hypothetical protein
MEQTSKALNFCVSQDEFLGSGERVEGERLLLESTHKYSAATAEIRRLSTEGAIGKSTPQKNKPGKAKLDRHAHIFKLIMFSICYQSPVPAAPSPSLACRFR